MSAFINFLVASVDSMLTMNSPKRTGAKESGLSTEQTIEPPPRPKDLESERCLSAGINVIGCTVQRVGGWGEEDFTKANGMPSGI